MDENLDHQYEAEQRLGKVFMTFSILTILIACIGLLGLAAFATAQRTKEIGIRKVLGASSGGVVGLLCRDFVRLVCWPMS